MKPVIIIAIVFVFSFTIIPFVYAERDCPEDRICAFPNDFLEYRTDSILSTETITFQDYSGSNLIQVTHHNSIYDEPENYGVDVRDGQRDDWYFDDSWKVKFSYMIPIPIKVGDPLHTTNEDDVPIFEYETTYSYKNQDRDVIVAIQDLDIMKTEYIVDKKTGIILQTNLIPAKFMDNDPIITKLIDTNIIHDSIAQKPQPQEIVESVQKIPDWVKNSMKWFIDGVISEDEMISALQFLIKEGIIKVL